MSWVQSGVMAVCTLICCRGAAAQQSYQAAPPFGSAYLPSGQVQSFDPTGSPARPVAETHSAGLYSADASGPYSADITADDALTVEQRLGALEAFMHSAPAPQVAAPAPKPATVYPNVTINGAFQADAVLFHQDAASEAVYGDIQDGADFRRARLSAKGSVAANMNYFMQFDFGAIGRPTFTDLWVEWTNIPVLGTVRVGQWKHPFSLEVVSSYRYTTFMERSSLFQAFTPFRHIGIGFYNHSEDLNSTWAASLIRTGQDQFGGSVSDDGGNGVVARVTHLPWYDEQCGDDYLHVGAGYYLNSPPNDVARFRSIPEIFVGEFASLGGTAGSSGQALPGVNNGTPFFVDTGPVGGVDHVHTFGLESLWVAGPLSIQSEAMAAVIDQAAADTVVLDGVYVQAGYFLTGEHRPYDRVAGAIDRVKPHRNFFGLGCPPGSQYGLGAFEIAARYSHLDLVDGNINGGRMDNVTGGINWYCNPYCKVVLNYIHSWAEPASGVETETNAFAFRTQVDF